MSRLTLCVLFLVLALVFAPALLAQSDSGQDKKDEQTSTASSAPEEGVQSGGYIIHQAIEIGAHFVGSSGNQDVYNSFVNLDTGPRLLEYNLSMHAQPGTGLLFDDLSMSNFGYGGDPNNMTRLRISKTKMYDFRGQFRRDRNYWNFNQLANPFNPAVPSPPFPANNIVTFTPHRLELVRRMTDLDLTLLPQQPVSVRLGYGRNIMEGPSNWSYYEGTPVLLDQPWLTTSNRFRAGIDFNMIPRTRISFDQYFDWFKQDTSASLAPFMFGQLADGSLNGFPIVELGLVADVGSPCAAPITDATVTPPAINATCIGYIQYARSNPWRGSYPTSFLSFQSSYWQKVDLQGSLSYSGGELDGQFQENFFGRISRTFQQRYDISGPVANNRVAINADFGVTFHVTDWFRIIDKFNWTDFRLPGAFNLTELSQFSNSMAVEANVFNPATCPANPATCPLYAGSPANSSSPADVTLENFRRYFGQDAKSNLVEAQFDFGRKGGFSAGYRLRNREIAHREVAESFLTYYPGRYASSAAVTAARGNCRAGNAFGAVPDPVTGVCTVSFVTGVDPLTGEAETELVDITEHAFVAGVWVRPYDWVRFSYDLDWMNADNIYTRITPESSRQHKFRLMVKPRKWVNFTGTVNLLDMETDEPSLAVDPTEPDAGIDFSLKVRNYGFVTSLLNHENYVLDFAYNYNTYDSSNSICFIDTAPPPDVTPDPLRCGNAAGQQFGFSFWENRLHFGSVNFMYRPTDRVTAMLGYSVTSSAAVDALQTNPLGSPVLGINYHLPSVMLSYKFSDRWMIKGGYNHYGYNEKFDPGRVNPRDFRANVGTIALRYEF
jgi:hypothetical protein